MLHGDAVLFEFADHCGLADLEEFGGLPGGAAAHGGLEEHFVFHGLQGLGQAGVFV